MSEHRRDSHMWQAQIRAIWGSRMAEYYGSKDMADVVAQLRRRSRIANARAKWVLATLITAVLIGLAAYVVWPVMRQYVDGQRAELQRTLESLDAVDRNLTRDRIALQNSLAEKISGFGSTYYTGFDSFLDGHLTLKNGKHLIYGDNGAFVLAHKEGVFQELTTKDTDSRVYNHISLKNGGHLIYGDVLVSVSENGDVGDPEPIAFDEDETYFDHIRLSDGTYLL